MQALIKKSVSILVAILLIVIHFNPLSFFIKAASPGDGTYTWPVTTDHVITAGYYYPKGGFHGATDFGCSIGTPVYATAAGTVIEVVDRGCQGSHNSECAQYLRCPLGTTCEAVTGSGSSKGSYGNYITIDHGNNVYSLYGHLQTGFGTSISVGTKVAQGQQIAYSGNAGNSTGPHLHFEMRMGSNSYSSIVDPQNYLTKLKPDPQPTPIDIDEGTYIIQSVKDPDKVIDIAGDSTANQANIQLYENLHNQVQKFQIIREDDYYCIKSVYSGKWFDIASPYDEPGSNVQLWNSNTNKEEHWVFEDAGDGNVYIKSLYGLYVDTGGPTDNHTNIQMCQYDQTPSQQWKLIRVSPSARVTIPDGVYKIQSVRNPGKVLDIQYDSSENRANIQLYDDLSNNVQKFRVVNHDGYCNIKSEYSGYWLDTASPMNTDGCNIQLFSDNSKPEEKWIFEDAGNGNVSIRSLYDVYIDTDGGKTENNTNVETLHYDGTTSQQWKFIDVENVDLGEDFFGSIVNTATGRIIGNYDNNVQASNNETNDPKLLWHFIRNGDGSYLIYNAYNGTLLTAENSGTSNGANAYCQKKYVGESQHWFVKQKDDGICLVSVSGNRFLSLKDGSSTPGTNVYLLNYSGSAAQYFTIQKENGYVKPVAPDKPNLSISSLGAADANTVFTWTESPLKSTKYDQRTYNFRIWQGSEVGENTEVYFHADNLTNTECSVQLPEGVYTATVTAVNTKYHWYGTASSSRTFTVGASAHDYSADFFASIINTATGRIIGKYDNNNNVQASNNETNDPRLLWHFIRNEDYSYLVYNTYDGTLLTAENSGTSNGANVFCQKSYIGASQHWNIVQKEDGLCLVSASGNKMLSLKGGSPEPGTNVYLWSYNGSQAQFFTVQREDDYVKPAAPDASVLSISTRGDEKAATIFSWSESPLNSEEYDQRTYNFRIWQGSEIGENTEVYLLAADLTDTWYSVQLPTGVYTATVTAVNTKYHWFGTASEPITLTIGDHTSHTWDSGVVTTVATCNATGVITYTCTAESSGETKTEIIKKDPNNHVGGTEIRHQIAATCGTDGYTGNLCCKGCNAILSSGTYIPATGNHTWDTGVVTIAATTTAEGIMTYTCTVCGATNTEAIPMLVSQWNKEQVKNLTVTTVSAGKATLTWDAVPGAEKYMVYYSATQNGSFTAYGISATPSYTMTKTNAGSLFYKVRAFVTVDGERQYGAVSSAVCGAPGQVKNLKATVVSANKAALTWDAVPGAEKYLIYYSAAKDGEYTSYIYTASTSYTFRKTGAGSMYYKVRAAVTVNGSKVYGAHSAAVRALPGQVKNLTAATVSANKATLTWDEVPGAEKYMVYYSDSADGAYTAYAYPSGTTYTMSKSGAGTMYYKVRAFVTVDGNKVYGAYSDAVRAVPGKVTNLIAETVSANKAALTWDAVPGAEKYMVYYSTAKDGPFTAYGITAVPSYTMSKSGAGTMYYKVRAFVTADGSKVYGAYSDAVHAVPGQVKNLTATLAASNKAALTWDAVTGAEKYMVYYSATEDGGYTAYGITAATSYTVTKSNAAALYYKVRAFVTVNDVKVYGAYSDAAQTK